MKTAARRAFVVLGNQLFSPKHLAPYRDAHFFMAEDLGLCTYVRHHKQKVALFLAAMRSYRDELIQNGFTVRYRALPEDFGLDNPSYEQKLRSFLADHPVDALLTWEVEDKPFEKRLQDFAATENIRMEFVPSPMFLTSRTDFQAWRNEAPRLQMAHFYRWQRRRLEVLLDHEGKPTGGSWSFDADNRKALPKSVEIPKFLTPKPTAHVQNIITMVNLRFPTHPGVLEPSGWWWPTTRSQAIEWLDAFLTTRFPNFGPYEDALSERDPFLFHSALSPLLNLGLLTPDEVLKKALRHAAQHAVPLNSLEGFVRQLIGWREFVRGVYQTHSDQQESGNFFGHHRKLSPHWYAGTTGIVPLDAAIHKAERLGWAHHIERLMVIGNLMLLTEIHPQEAHRWFMEMFVDSSEWVMGPNVYGMSLFADGGLFASKPYICGSNYLLKMSDHKKPKTPNAELGGTWCEVLDGLYWRFIDRHRDFFRSQARMGQAVGTLDRMDPARRHHIIELANQFIDRVTT